MWITKKKPNINKMIHFITIILKDWYETSNNKLQKIVGQFIFFFSSDRRYLDKRMWNFIPLTYIASENGLFAGQTSETIRVLSDERNFKNKKKRI